MHRRLKGFHRRDCAKSGQPYLGSYEFIKPAKQHGGRTPIEPAQRLTEHFHFRATAQERREFEQAAATRGIPLSKLLREFVSRCVELDRPPAEQAAVEIPEATPAPSPIEPQDQPVAKQNRQPLPLALRPPRTIFELWEAQAKRKRRSRTIEIGHY